MFSGRCRCLAQARGGRNSRFSQLRGYSTVGSAIRSQRIGCGGARPPCARNVCWQKHSDAATHKGVSPKWGEARSSDARCLWHRTSEAEVGDPFRGFGGTPLAPYVFSQIVCWRKIFAGALKLSHKTRCAIFAGALKLSHKTRYAIFAGALSMSAIGCLFSWWRERRAAVSSSRGGKATGGTACRKIIKEGYGNFDRGKTDAAHDGSACPPLGSLRQGDT